MAKEATGRESDKFMLRLPDGMRDRLKEAAEENKRSMNAEIVARLEFTLEAPKRIADEKEQIEVWALRERRDAMRMESKHLLTQIAEVATRLARIEDALIEKDAKARGRRG